MDKQQTTINTFNEAADQYLAYFKDSALYQPTYDDFLGFLTDKQTKLLELACGPGNVNHYLLKQKPELDILGIDLAPRMIELAKELNTNATYCMMDVRQIKQIKPKFDAIMCGFCVPYLPWIDSQKLIQDMANKLNSDGVLYLSLTDGNNKDNGFQASKSAAGGVYIHYHDTEEILTTLKQASMEILSEHSLTHIHNDQETKDLFILAKKQADA